MSIDNETGFSTVLNQPHSLDVIELLYNVFAQGTRAHLETIRTKGIALVIKVPLASGWLAGKFDEGTVSAGIRERWTKADIARRAELTEKLKSLLSRDNLTA